MPPQMALRDADAPFSATCRGDAGGQHHAPAAASRASLTICPSRRLRLRARDLARLIGLRKRDRAGQPERRRRATRQLAVPASLLRSRSARHNSRDAASQHQRRRHGALPRRRRRTTLDRRPRRAPRRSAARQHECDGRGDQQAFERNSRASTSPNVSAACPGCRWRRPGTSDSTRIGTGTSEYCASRPAARSLRSASSARDS